MCFCLGIAYIKYSKTSEAMLAVEEMNSHVMHGHSKPLKVITTTMFQFSSVIESSWWILVMFRWSCDIGNTACHCVCDRCVSNELNNVAYHFVLVRHAYINWPQLCRKSLCSIYIYIYIFICTVFVFCNVWFMQIHNQMSYPAYVTIFHVMSRKNEIPFVSRKIVKIMITHSEKVENGQSWAYSCTFLVLFI